MTHDTSSPSKLLVPESHTRNLEAIAHVLFCPSFWYQTNVVPACMTDYSSYCYKILVPVTWTENLYRVSWGLDSVPHITIAAGYVQDESQT